MQGEETDPCRGGGETDPCRGEETDPCRGGETDPCRWRRLIHAGAGGGGD